MAICLLPITHNITNLQCIDREIQFSDDNDGGSFFLCKRMLRARSKYWARPRPCTYIALLRVVGVVGYIS